MARLPNPYYREPADPSASIGQSLGRALFGDPGMAAQQQDQMAQQAQRDAAAQESTAHARLYGSQADGSDATNTANASLPQMFASMYAPPPTPTVAPTIEAGPKWTPSVAHTAAPTPAAIHGDAGLPQLFASMSAPMVAPTIAQSIMPGAPDNPPPSPVAPAPPADSNATFHTGLPALLAALGQAGHGAEADKLVRTLAAFGGGGDAMQRAGLIAGGDSPSKDFAGTPERADTIAANAAGAEFKKATAVATIDHRFDVPVAFANHASDVPVANIRAREGLGVATINHATDIPVANIAAGSREAVAGARRGENSLGDMLVSLYPGAHLGSENRTQAEQNGLIARGVTKATNSYHIPGRFDAQGRPIVAVDMRPIPGVSLGQVVANLQAHGVVFAEPPRMERGGPNDGTGTHMHFAASVPATSGGRGSAAAKPRSVNMKALNDEVKKRFTDPSTSVTNYPVGSVLNAVRERAAALYQQSGNPVAAVRQAMAETQARGAAIRQSMTSMGAQKAPDGNWYVQRGKHPDGSPAYFQVQH